MSNLQIPRLDILTQRDPMLGEALRALQDSLNTVAAQTGATAQGTQSTPNAPAQLNVTSAGGIFDIAIQDNLPSQIGIAPDYFLEYSLTPNFSTPTQIHLGPARNHRATLGNQTLYWRCYSQYGRASQPSEKTYFGTILDPKPVVGGGSITGPNLLASAGSGTAPTNGTRGGSGYGVLPVRN